MITALNRFIVWQYAHILIITGTEWVCCLAELAGYIHSLNSTELVCCLSELARCIHSGITDLHCFWLAGPAVTPPLRKTRSGVDRMVEFWFTIVGWASLSAMRSLTMPWLGSGSRRTATQYCDATKFMMAGMGESASSMVAKVSSMGVVICQDVNACWFMVVLV